MERKDLLVVGGIIGAIIVLIGAGIAIYPNSTSGDNSMSLYGLNSADENSTAEPAAEENVFFLITQLLK